MNEKTKKILGILMVLIFVSVCVNLVYAYSIRLNHPIFVTKYESINVDENGSYELSIGYIKNNSDKRQLVAIEFEGLDQKYDVYDIGYMRPLFNSDINPIGKGRHFDYSSKVVYLEFDDMLVEQVDEMKKLILTKARLYFDDQSTLDVEIGELRLQRYKEEKDFLSVRSGGSIKHHTNRLEINGPIMVNHIDLSTYEAHKGEIMMSITVDGDRSYTYDTLSQLKDPIEVKRWIEVNYELKNVSQSEKWRFDNISLKFDYEKDGVEDTYRTRYSFGSNLVDDETIEAYVKLRRAYD